MLNKILGRKQNIKNEEFDYVYQNIEKFVSFDHIKKIQKEIIHEIIGNTKDKKVAMGWGAGKDSIVLYDMYKLAGYIKGIYGLTRGLQFTGLLKWLKINKPPGIEIVYTEHDLKWLAKNQWALFPNGARGLRFRTITHTASEERYCKENNIEIMIYGRRIIDGNICGKGKDKIYRAKGRLQYNPLKFWSHEEILGYLRYFNLSLPPIYSYPGGWLEGAGCWNNMEHGHSISEQWNTIFMIEPEIVIKAAEYIKSAQDYLLGKEK